MSGAAACCSPSSPSPSAPEGPDPVAATSAPRLFASMARSRCQDAVSLLRAGSRGCVLRGETGGGGKTETAAAWSFEEGSAPHLRQFASTLSRPPSSATCEACVTAA